MATKVAGLFGDGVDGSCTPISGCAQRARCGKLLSLCRDCALDTRLPPVSLLSGLQAVSPYSFHQVPWWWQGEGWWRIRAILGVSQRARGVSRRRTRGTGQMSGYTESCKLSLQQKQVLERQATLVWRFPSWPTYHQTGWLKIAEVYSLTVLEARSLKPWFSRAQGSAGPDFL